MTTESVEGKGGTAQHVGSDWVGWSGRVAHPDAPLGGGGPGFFAEAGGRLPPSDGVGARNDLPHPGQPGPLDALAEGDAPAAAPKPANAPPTTVVKATWTLLNVQKDHVDVDIKAEVVADGTGGPTNGANTSFDWPASKAPGYSAENGKVKSFDGKLTWKGTVKIQTKYGTGASATTLSCYGRGTTDADVKARDITLGFHESCHRADFLAYLDAHPLPEPPELTVGMPTTDYDTAAADYAKAITDYRKDMKADSDTQTDEVGHKKSQVATDGCYVHELP